MFRLFPLSPIMYFSGGTITLAHKLISAVVMRTFARGCAPGIVYCGKFRKKSIIVTANTLGGYCTSYPKISLFCALSQNYQHLYEK